MSAGRRCFLVMALGGGVLLNFGHASPTPTSLEREARQVFADCLRDAIAAVGSNGSFDEEVEEVISFEEFCGERVRTLAQSKCEESRFVAAEMLPVLNPALARKIAEVLYADSSERVHEVLSALDFTSTFGFLGSKVFARLLCEKATGEKVYIFSLLINEGVAVPPDVLEAIAPEVGVGLLVMYHGNVLSQAGYRCLVKNLGNHSSFERGTSVPGAPHAWRVCDEAALGLLRYGCAPFEEVYRFEESLPQWRRDEIIQRFEQKVKEGWKPDIRAEHFASIVRSSSAGLSRKIQAGVNVFRVVNDPIGERDALFFRGPGKVRSPQVVCSMLDRLPPNRALQARTYHDLLLSGNASIAHSVVYRLESILDHDVRVRIGETLHDLCWNGNLVVRNSARCAQVALRSDHGAVLALSEWAQMEPESVKTPEQECENLVDVMRDILEWIHPAFRNAELLLSDEGITVQVPSSAKAVAIRFMLSRQLECAAACGSCRPHLAEIRRGIQRVTVVVKPPVRSPQGLGDKPGRDGAVTH